MLAKIQNKLIEFLVPSSGPVRPVRGSVFIAGGYTVTAILWLLVSGVFLWGEVFVDDQARVIVLLNGALFVVVTTAVLLGVTYRYLRRLSETEERFAKAQEELRQKDLAVRQGYVDVLDAVTGGRFILITEDELRGAVGDVVMPPQPLLEAKGISEARKAIAAAIEPLPVRDRDGLILAVSEALTNAVKHGGHGEYGVYRSGSCVQIVVRDFGKGIDFRSLPKATLVQGFSTTNTMGLGFTIMLEVSDRVLLTTDTTGTVVVLESELEVPAAVEESRSLASILSA